MKPDNVCLKYWTKCGKQQKTLERDDNTNNFIQKQGNKIIFTLMWLKMCNMGMQAGTKGTDTQVELRHGLGVWVEMSLHLSQNQVEFACWEKLYTIMCKWLHSYTQFTNLVIKEERNNVLDFMLIS